MAKAIMIQGTASNVGKSLLCAALCRIFREDGYSVAPFKSQNMALNSFITEEGLEIGRAQAVQAQAAGIAPSALMNPILLKPSSDTGSQVIVMGEVYGNLSARDYFATKHTLVPQIQKAYETLAAQYDIIVIEGAGSPAEINLKQNDFVNMGMAAIADAPVLLCGDIDRGGVFAALAGTLLLLEPEEQARVKGMIINKFRGDKALLQPGVVQIEQRTGLPVLGVIPCLDVEIDDEDSLSERLGKTKVGAIDIAVIRLPRLSNFTDFNFLELADDLCVRYVSDTSQLGKPDMLILPGTKNTMEDLLWMRQNGLESAVKKYAAAGGIVFGICGGYQMLGESLCDPDGVEHGGSIAGMGLLPGVTTFAQHKTRTRTEGHFGTVYGALSALSGVAFSGYEIHMGETTGSHPLTYTVREGAQARDGEQCGNLYGSYYHGIFDGEAVVEALANALAKHKGIERSGTPVCSAQQYREGQYARLAQGVREHLDIDAIYQILGM